MGVGELSALNGVAGAYTEQVKTINIVGTTSTAVQKNRTMIHHCLGPDPDHRVYEKISSHVRAAHCWLDDIDEATFEIDRVLRICMDTSLPVYIFIPMNFVHQLVEAPLSLRSLDLPPAPAPEPLISLLLSSLYAARNPVVIVDALVSRHRATPQARALLDLLHVPTFSTPMGKSIVNGSRPYYRGTYIGQLSSPEVLAAIETESDLVLDLGPMHTDSNTGGHSRRLAADKVIEVYPKEVIVRGKVFPNEAGIRALLAGLVAGIDVSRLPVVSPPKAVAAAELAVNGAGKEEKELITQSWIWPRIAKFLRPGDVLVAESGTAQFGLSDVVLPDDVTYITQMYYASIGYALPACLGAAVAKRELGHGEEVGRVVLVTGDGSAQLTVQEVGTMVKLGLKNVLILVINNNGYTIERAIHGPEEVYNDIAAWDWQLMLSFFGDKNGRARSREAQTKADLENILALPQYTTPESIQVLEVHMGKMDVPRVLREYVELVAARTRVSEKHL
ncbi:putative pyruvate decarboxylase C13A11.06 [Lasiodiplodia hormozganensis]|uniref:Pyruvate decarboxylase n=1 Tax=Lasiodiplodia hormozganensis TaxID=869390 RepID=A0AA39XUC5_9PEZI|nr:putative pyruvate decarboxylase C13A11.06 [Lasiodiplodia hormozganensis]